MAYLTANETNCEPWYGGRNPRIRPKMSAYPAFGRGWMWKCVVPQYRDKTQVWTSHWYTWSDAMDCLRRWYLRGGRTIFE
jgi:hypothetical protein